METKVNILDKKTGDSTGRYSGTIGVHGNTLDYDVSKGFTSNGKVEQCFFVFWFKDKPRNGFHKDGRKPGCNILCEDYSGKIIYPATGESKDLTVMTR